MSKPVKLILVEGLDGIKYSPYAIYLAKKARADGHTDGFSRVVVIDGVTMRVALSSSEDRVYLSSEVCPAMVYTGFADTYRSWATMTWGNVQRAIEKQEDAEDLPRERNGEWLPGDPCTKSIRFINKKASENNYPLVDVRPPVPNVDEWRKHIDWYKPTRFTGLMRRALQATYATTEWQSGLTYKVTPTAQPAFALNYVWGDSWGLVLAEGKDGSKPEHYFLIQITGSEVFWTPVQICVHTIKPNPKDPTAPKEVTYAPIIRKIHRAKSVSLGKMEYRGLSQFETIGWSFSYTKPEAAVVVHDLREEYTAPQLYTQLLTLKITFDADKGIPNGIDLKKDKECRLWYTPGDGIAFNGLGRDIVGNVCSDDLYNVFKKGPSAEKEKIDAPVYVFYNTEGDQVVSRVRRDTSGSSDGGFTPTEVRTVGSWNRLGYSPYTINYNPVASTFDPTAGATQGTSSCVLASVGAGSMMTPTRSAASYQSGTIHHHYADVDLAPTASVTYNAGVTFTTTAPNTFLVYGASCGIFIRTTGTISSPGTSASGGAALVPDDREVVLVASSSTSGATVDSTSYDWYMVRKWPGSSAAIVGNSILYPTTATGTTWPGLTEQYYVDLASPPTAAPAGYYTGTFLSYSMFAGTQVLPYLPPGASLPAPTSRSSPGSHSEQLVAETSSFRVTLSDNIGMLVNVMRGHKPLDPDQNDSYIPTFVQSAFRTDRDDGYVVKDENKNQLVVHIHGKVYNVDRYTYCWLGVV